jgi:uncharacterized membrane protein
LIPGARFLTSKKERRESLEKRAHQAFAQNEVGLTPERNGVLLYFSLPEKMFYLVPDTPLVRHFPSSEWDATVAKVHEALQKSEKNSQLETAILALLEDLDKKAALRLRPKSHGESAVNALSNAVVFEA